VTDRIPAPAERAASDLLGADPFASHGDRLSVVVYVGGQAEASAVPELVVLDWEGEVAAAVPSGRRRGGRGVPGYRFAVLPGHRWVAALEAWDDEALDLLRHGRVVHDPAGRARRLWGRPLPIPPRVWEDKIRSRYLEFRRRQASLAWNLRRGEAFGALENVTRAVAHALTLALYLDGQVPPRRWLHRAAFRTQLGRQIRPLLFELVTSLGELATLGGSWSLRENRVYGPVARIQSVLAAAVESRGRGAGGAEP
jgi:hypothetical protein